MAITIDNLTDGYAAQIASSVGLTASDYERTANGLADLLRDAADRLGSIDQVIDWLAEAADDLTAVARLGDGGAKEQQLLGRVDTTLYEAWADLELR